MDVIALLGAELDGVAEPARGDQCGAGALAFDDQVGDEGGAVQDAVELGIGGAGRGEQLVQTRERAFRRVERGSQPLVYAQPRCLCVKQHEVGKGAPDIECTLKAGRRP